MHIENAIKQFMEHLRANDRSPHTLSSYKRDLKTFAKWLTFEHLPATVKSVTPETTLRFFSSPLATVRLDGRPKKQGSINRMKLVLKSFFAYLEEAWVIQRSPARLLRCKRERKPVTNILSTSETNRLLAALRTSDKPRAIRDAAILSLFLHTGIRIDSLVHLDTSDVNLARKTLRLRIMKGNVQSAKTLPNGLAKELKQYLAYRNAQETSSPALFLSNRKTRLSNRMVQCMVKDWAKAAGIEKNISSRTFRHTFASRLYRKSRDLVAVKEALDHSSVTVSEIYTHVAMV